MEMSRGDRPTGTWRFLDLDYPWIVCQKTNLVENFLPGGYYLDGGSL
jgi:hypothetical protein